jgi:hypothetical protein
VAKLAISCPRAELDFSDKLRLDPLREVLPAGTPLDDLLKRRRPFLTAKQLLTNQTFRDIFRADTLDVDQRLKITSLTFLFTDLPCLARRHEKRREVAMP